MSTGLHARRVTGLTVSGTEESFIRNESVARWSREGRAAYKAEREALLFDFCSTGTGYSNQTGTNYVRGDGGYFFKQTFVLPFFCGVMLGCPVLCRASFFRAYQEKREEAHACGVRVVFLGHGAPGICKSPVCNYFLGRLFPSILPPGRA